MNILHRLVSWDINDTKQEKQLQRRHKLFELYIFLGSSLVFISTIVYFLLGDTVRVTMYLSAITMSTLLFFFKRHNKAWFQIKFHLLVAVLFLLFILLQIFVGDSSGGLTRLLLFPFIAITLLGVKKGFACVVLLQISLAYLFSNDLITTSDTTFTSMIFSLLIMSGLTSALETIINYEEELLSDTALKLKELNSDLHKEVSKQSHELLRQSEALKLQLVTNHLTKLPNTRRLYEVLSDIKASHGLQVHLNSYKQYSDFYGPEFTDKLIISFVDAITPYLIDYKLSLFHLDTHDFFIFEHTPTSVEHYQQFVKDFYTHLTSTPLIINDTKIYVQITLGISVNSTNPLIESNIALGRAKKERLSTLYYDKNWNIQEKIAQNIKIRNEINDAIKDDRILVFYQPIVDAVNHQTIKYEALIRMKAEDGSIKSPFYFLDVAKKVKLLPKLTMIVLKDVIKKTQESSLTFSFNLTAYDISDEILTQQIYTEIFNSNVANRLVVEIVESESIKDYAVLQKFLRSLKLLGVQVSIDDFGTGYSNFSQVSEMEADILKIDGSLIKNILSSKKHQSFVTAILTMTKSLELKTVAEFVETKEVADYLKELGVDYLQGYYFSEPLENIFTCPIDTKRKS